MVKQSKINGTVLLQDLGMFLFLVSLFGAAFIAAFAGIDLLTQNMILLSGVALVTVLIVFRVQYVGAVVAAFEMIAFTVFKLFRYFADGQAIESTAYFWPFVMLGAVGGLALFLREYEATEAANQMLRQQLEELTVIDPLTGLENLRGMYKNLSRTMALCRRHGMPMGLMIVKVRYASELRKILSRNQFGMLLQRLTTMTADTIRISDRVYLMDADGTFGIIYFSDQDGADIIRRRLNEAYSLEGAFDGIGDKTLKVEMRIAFAQYDLKEELDPIALQRKAESEMQYAL